MYRIMNPHISTTPGVPPITSAAGQKRWRSLSPGQPRHLPKVGDMPNKPKQIGLRSSLSSDCKSKMGHCCSSTLFSNILAFLLPSFLPSSVTHSLTYLPTMQIVANVKPTASVAKKKVGLSGLYVFKKK